MADWRVELGLGEKEREHLLTADTPFEEILRRLRGRDNPPRPRPKPGKAGGPYEGASRSVKDRGGEIHRYGYT